MTKKRVSHLDIFPTVLDLLSVQSFPSTRGIPLSKFDGELPARYIFGVIQSLQSELMLLSWPWKYVQSAQGRDRLYNLLEDPEEKQNLISIEQERAHHMQKVMGVFLDRQYTYYSNDKFRNQYYPPRIVKLPKPFESHI